MIQGYTNWFQFFSNSNSVFVSRQNVTKQCSKTTAPIFHFPRFNMNSVFSVTNGGLPCSLYFAIVLFLFPVKTKCSMAPLFLLSMPHKMPIKIDIWDSLNQVEKSTWTFNDCLLPWRWCKNSFSRTSTVNPILDMKSDGVCWLSKHQHSLYILSNAQFSTKTVENAQNG